MTNEEKNAKAEAEDLLIKQVFDNVRNILICVALALAGGAVIKYRLDLPFGSIFNGIIGSLIVLAAISLFMWNAVHGIEKLARPVKGTRKSWLLIPFVAVYIISILAVFQASIHEKSSQKFKMSNIDLLIEVRRAG
jgi:fumarate reductase subunit D